MESGNKKWKKMITLIKNSMWMYPWEVHVAERGFQGCNGWGALMPEGIFKTSNEIMQMLRALLQC